MIGGLQDRTISNFDTEVLAATVTSPVAISKSVHLSLLRASHQLGRDLMHNYSLEDFTSRGCGTLPVVFMDCCIFVSKGECRVCLVDGRRIWQNFKSGCSGNRQCNNESLQDETRTAVGLGAYVEAFAWRGAHFLAYSTLRTNYYE